MPLDYKIENQEGLQLAVWYIAEEDEYFLSKLDIHGPEEDIIKGLSKRKKREWLSSRYLLHLMSGRPQRGEFTKDVHGKPHLKGSTHHVSISHSRNKIAVIASSDVVGVDIQYYIEKIDRIQHKFVSEIEEKMILNDLRIKYLHIIWGAKEALYKAYGKRGLDFKKHIAISKLKITENNGSCVGIVEKEDYKSKFSIHYKLKKDYVLVYAKELN